MNPPSTTSRGLAFKLAVRDKLKARPGLAGVVVSWGIPKDTAAKEVILLLRLEEQQEAAALGARRREAHYTLHVYISVLRQRGEHELSTTRAYAILGEIEAELRDDATLGGVVRVAEIDSSDLAEVASAEDIRCESLLAVRIKATARI